MGNYQELYNKKKVSIDEAISHVKSDDAIYMSMGAMEPMTLLSGLHKAAEDGKKGIIVTSGLDMRAYPYNSDPKYRDAIRNVSMFMMPASRKLFAAGLVEHAPCDLGLIPSRRHGYLRPTVAFIAATPMDSHGYLRCSLSMVHEGELIDTCERIIVEVNPNFPVVGGDTAIHISQITCLIETDTPIPQLPKCELEENDKTIGGYIAELIKDGDTIQLGIGGIPDAAAVALEGKKNLGVHTEMLTNSIAMLVEKGAIDGSKKTLHKRKIVAAFAFGNQDLYNMVHNNPGVEILRGTYINNPFVVAQNDNMISVNSCIAVDLTGQVCSESIGPVQYSGTGGATDFAYGASRAKNGRNVIALQSTAKNGEVSKITSMLEPGSIVSIRRNIVDYIVTEYGVAPMRGRDIRGRVNNLIAVAHPNFREQLKAEADKLGLH